MMARVVHAFAPPPLFRREDHDGAMDRRGQCVCWCGPIHELGHDESTGELVLAVVHSPERWRRRTRGRFEDLGQEVWLTEGQADQAVAT